MINNYKSNDGFTIIELLVSMGLFVLILAAIGSMFISSLNSAQVNENKSLLKRKRQIIMARLAKDLRGAAEINDEDSDWSGNELVYKLDPDMDDNIEQVGRYHFESTANTLISYSRNDSSYPSNWNSYKEKQFIGGDEIIIVRQEDSSGNKLDVFSYDHKLKLLNVKFKLVYTHKNSEVIYSVNDSIKLRNVGNFEW